MIQVHHRSPMSSPLYHYLRYPAAIFAVISLIAMMFVYLTPKAYAGPGDPVDLYGERTPSHLVYAPDKAQDSDSGNLGLIYRDEATSTEYIYLSPITDNSSTDIWDSTVSQMLPVITQGTRPDGEIKTTKVPGNENFEDSHQFEWCPAARFQAMTPSGAVGDKVYFENDEKEIFPLKFPGSNDPLILNNGITTNMDLYYSLLMTKGRPVGLSQNQWDKWKARFFKDRKVTYNPDDLNLEEPVYVKKGDSGDLKYWEESQFYKAHGNKTLFFHTETVLKRQIKRQPPQDVAKVESHQQLMPVRITAGQSAHYLISSQATVTPLQGDYAHKPFTIKINAQNNDNVDLKHELYKNMNQLIGAPEKIKDIDIENYKSFNNQFEGTDRPICAPENMTVTDADQAYGAQGEKVRSYLRSADVHDQRQYTGFYYQDTLPQDWTNDEIRDKATFPSLLLPTQVNPGADKQLSYPLESGRPLFVNWYTKASGTATRPPLILDQKVHIINTFTDESPKVKIEKFTIKKDDPKLNTPPERKDTAMQVGLKFEKNRAYPVKVGTNTPWQKGAGENAEDDIKAGLETSDIGPDSARHTTKGNAEVLEANNDQTGAKYQVTIGFDIINVKWGTDINELLITDENIAADLTPEQWKTAESNRFTCEIKKEQFLYPYHWARPSYTTQYVPLNAQKSLDIIGNDGKAYSTDGKESVKLASQWNETTKREELSIRNITLPSAKKLDGSEAAPKIRCETTLSIATSDAIDLNDFQHHNKVRVEATRHIPVVETGKFDPNDVRTKPTKKSTDADNWWSVIQPRAEIDIMSQISHGDKADTGFYRHDFMESGKVEASTTTPSASKALNEFFRVSAGYQKRETAEHLETHSDLHKLRLKPVVHGTPVKVCSPISYVSFSENALPELDKDSVPDVVKKFAHWDYATVYGEQNQGLVVTKGVKQKIYELKFYARQGVPSTPQTNTITVTKTGKEYSIELNGTNLFKNNVELKGCADTKAACEVSTSEKFPPTGAGVTTQTMGTDAIFHELFGIENLLAANVGNSWLMRTNDQLQGTDIQNNFNLKTESELPMTVAGYKDNGLFGVKTCEPTVVPVDEYIGAPTALMDCWPDNVEIKFSREGVPTTASKTDADAHIAEWTTSITKGNDTSTVVWNKDNQNDRLAVGTNGPTIGLNGTLDFAETVTYKHDSARHLYEFTTHGKTTKLYYDPKTKVPVDAAGHHISGDITLGDPLGTKAHINFIDKTIIIDDKSFTLDDKNGSVDYTSHAPIKEVNQRTYRNYSADNRLTKADDAIAPTGCGPHVYQKPDARQGQDALCDPDQHSGKQKDASNTFVNDKTDLSHNFTTDQPKYAATYGDDVYSVVSQPTKVVRGDCNSDEKLHIDKEGFVELFDSTGYDSYLSKDTGAFLDLGFGLSGLASGAASYTQVDTYGVRLGTDSEVTLQPRASVEAAYAYEPAMQVEKTATTPPVAKTADEIDVFKPGTLVSIEAKMKNAGSTPLSNIKFQDSTGGVPPVDFAQRLDGDSPVDGNFYAIENADKQVSAPAQYTVTDGVLIDNDGQPITVQPGETLIVYGVLTMDIPDPSGVHGDEIRFSSGDLNGTDSYRALVDEPQIIIQKVTAGGVYSELLTSLNWGECSYETPANNKCWKPNDANVDNAKYWEADGSDRLFLQPTKTGTKYVTSDQPVSMLVTNTGKTPLTELVVDDTTTNDAGGKVEWNDATVMVGKPVVDASGKITGVERVEDVTGKVSVVNPATTEQIVHVTLTKNGKDYPFNPGTFDKEDNLVVPGEFVVITGKLPASEIKDGDSRSNDHSNTVKATATSTKTKAQVVSNENDWNTETLKPSIAVKKYSGDEWEDPTGKPGDAQDILNAVEIPLEKYDESGHAVSHEQDVKILVTNNGNENLSYFSISDESVSSVNGEAGDWTTTGLTCMNTPTPDGAQYTVELQTTGEHQGEYKVTPAFAPGHSIRCETKLPALTFDAGFEPWHSNTVTVEGFGEKSKVKTNKDRDPWHAKARPAKVEIIKYSGQYHDSGDKHTLGNASEDADTDAVAIYADLNDGFKPNDKTVYYTIKNTGYDDMVKVNVTDGTLAETVAKAGDTPYKTQSGWVVDAVKCDVDAYPGVTPSSESIHTADNGNVAFNFIFTNEAPFKIGDIINCESTLKYVGKPLTFDDLIWHADRATVSGNGKTNPELETPEDDDPWNAYSAVPDVQIIKYIGPWENDLKWDGTKRGDLPDGDSDTAVQRGPEGDKQKSVFAQPQQNSGTSASPLYTIGDQEVGFTIRNTGKSELDTLIIEDYAIDGEASYPEAFETGPLTCEAGKGGLHKDATVTVDKDNQKKVTITFTEKNLYLPGQVFTCYSVLSGANVDPLKGAVHADEVSVVGLRHDKRTKKSTDPAHSYSTAPTIKLTKESFEDDNQSFFKHAGTKNDPDIAKPMTVRKGRSGVVGQPIPIRFTITTNGQDPLTLSTVKVTDSRDKKTQGGVTFNDSTINAKMKLKNGKVYDLKATFKACTGQNIADCSVVTFADETGEITLFSQGDTITYEGLLGETPQTSMEAGALHHNTATVEGVGEESKLKVKDKDDYYAKTVKPESKTDKYSNMPGTTESKKEQLDNNTCDGGENGTICVAPNADNKETSAALTVFMDYANTGKEDLTQIKMTDTTTLGVDVQIAKTALIGDLDANREFANERTVYLNEADLMFYDDKNMNTLSVLEVGKTLRIEGELPEGALDKSDHANTVKFEAVGIVSKFPTEDEDPYEATWRRPTEEPSPPSEEPSDDPSAPSEEPSDDPSAPSEEPSDDPSAPSEDPSTPSEEPSEDPSAPSEDPSAPSEDPSTPSEDPSAPSEQPSEEPHDKPSDKTKKVKLSYTGTSANTLALLSMLAFGVGATLSYASRRRLQKNK